MQYTFWNAGYWPEEYFGPRYFGPEGEEAPGALQAAISGVSALSSSIKATASIQSPLLGASTVLADLFAGGAMQANLSGLASVSANADAVGNIESAIAGAGELAGTLEGLTSSNELRADLIGSGDVSGTLSSIELSADISGAGSVTANLTFLNHTPLALQPSGYSGTSWDGMERPKPIVGNMSARVKGKSKLVSKAILAANIVALVTAGSSVSAVMKKNYTAADNQLWLL